MENFVKLKEWFVTRGGYVASDIEQRETEFGAGLCASVNHAEGEVLIRVPAKMLVSMGNVLKDVEFIQFCHGLKMTLTPIDLLALYLLYRRDQMPAYIDSLPKSFDCPLAWFADEVQSLPLQAKVFPLTTRAHCAKIAKKLTRFTRDEFLWAQCCVVTRNFLGPYAEYTKPPWLDTNRKNSHAVMAPLLDLANHAAKGELVWTVPPNATYIFDSDRNELVIEAYMPIQAGEQIFISYGHLKGDHELVSIYGFCMPPLVNLNTRVLISPVELLKVNGDLPKSTWLTPGADNLVKYSLSLKEVSEHLMYAIDCIAQQANTSFADIWTQVLSFKIERIKEVLPSLSKAQVQLIYSNEIAILNHYIEHIPYK